MKKTKPNSEWMKRIGYFTLFFLNSALLSAQSNFYSNTYLIGGHLHEFHLNILSHNHFYVGVKEPAATAAPTDSALLIEFDEDLIKTSLSRPPLTGITADELQVIYDDFYDFYMTPKIVITGNGLSNFTSSDPNAFTTSATAGFGVNVSQRIGVQWGILGTVSGVRDTIKSQMKRDFGTSILIPGVRKFSIMINYRDLYALGDYFGFGSFLNITPMVWQTNSQIKKGSNVYDSLPVNKMVFPITFEGYFSYTPFNQLGNNPLRITFDFGLTSKFLSGDRFSVQESQLFLGNTETVFVGALLGIDLHFSGVNAYFYGTFIPPVVSPINGLTGFQLIGAIGLTAPLANISK